MSRSDEAIAGDSCGGSSIGLDHLSLSVASMADLKAAVGLLDAKRRVSRMARSSRLSRSASPYWRFATRTTSRWS